MTENAKTGRKTFLFSASGLVLAAAAAALLNLVLNFACVRLDISKGRIYSINRATKRITAALEDPVLVKVYYSKELPSQIKTSGDYLKDLLREYAAYSKGRVKVSYKAIGPAREDAAEAVKNGIAPVRFSIFSNEKYEQREGFLGLTMQFRDKKDVIPFVQDVSNLEYDLTSRIEALTVKKKPEAAFIKSYGAAGLGDFDAAFLEKIKSRYAVSELSFDDIAASSGVPSNFTTLLFLGPEGRVKDRDLFFLDQYLLSGRSLMLAVDAKKIDTANFFARNNETGLDSFLLKNGVSLRNTVVMDEQSQPIQVQVNQGFFVVTNIVKYPPLVVSNDLSRTNPVTKDMDSMVFPFAAPLEISTSSALRFEVLARSSKYSRAKDPKSAGYLSINPFQRQESAETDLKGPFNIALAATGVFKPYFEGPPADLKVKDYLGESRGESRLLLVSTSKFAKSDGRARFADYTFFLNGLDWLSQASDLIAIRSKGSAFRPLREIPADRKLLVKYADIFAPPLLVLGLGVWRWRSGKKRRRRLAAQYGGSGL